MGVRLPAEYQEVEYLDSTSTLFPYIDTGIPITEDLKFEIEFMLINTNLRLYFMGMYRGTDFYLYTGGSGYFQTAFGTPYENTNLAVDTRRHRFVYQINDGILTVKDSDTVILTKQIGTLSANSILIAGTSSGGRTACKTFESKMTKAGVVIQDLIPCYRKSDSEPGMYDLVTNQFFTNAGTGEFLVGPDVIDSISPLMVAWRRALMMRKPDLPAGYKKLDYIQKQGTNAYINITGDLNLSLELGDVIGLTLSFIEERAGYQCFMGWPGKWEAHVQNMVFNIWYGVTQTSLLNETALPGVIYNPVYRAYDSRATEGLLFGTYNAGATSYPVFAKFYRLSISRNGNKLADLIPARRNSDRAIGLYDTVQGIFVTSSAVPFEAPEQ